MKRPAAGVTGEAARQPDQPAAQCASGAHGGVGEPEQLRPAQQVVGQAGEHRPGAVGVELPGGEVGERLVLEVGDHLLDHGVPAVLGLDQGDLLGAVGDEGEVAPVGPELGLGAEQAGAPDDQPPPAVVVSAICASPSSG